MPYTRVWDPDTPLGTEDADQIDDWIRDKLLDIQERFNTILGADSDMFDDPVVAAGYDLSALYAATKSITAIERSIPWYAGHIVVVAGTATRDQQKIVVTGTNGQIQAFVPVVLPVGVTITSVRARVFYNDTDHTLTGIFKGTKDGSDIFTTSFAAPSISGSPQWIAPASAPSHVVATETQYGFYINLNNNNLDTATELRLYGVQIQFTSPGAGTR